MSLFLLVKGLDAEGGEALYKFITTQSDATAATMQSNVWCSTLTLLWYFDANFTSVCVSGAVK